jgi:hypothetical protein
MLPGCDASLWLCPLALPRSLVVRRSKGELNTRLLRQPVPLDLHVEASFQIYFGACRDCHAIAEQRHTRCCYHQHRRKRTFRPGL